MQLCLRNYMVENTTFGKVVYRTSVCYLLLIGYIDFKTH